MVVGNALAMLTTSILAFDPRIDAYTRLIGQGARFIYSDAVETAADVKVPTLMKELAKIRAGLTNISIPTFDENEGDDRKQNEVVALANLAPFPNAADECGRWREGEDEEATVAASLTIPYPENRATLDYGPRSRRYSDEALEDLVFSGLGQYRVQRIDPGDTTKPTGAVYAVYLNFAASFEVRPGFARLGADAYFDGEKKILAIARGGRLYRPDGPQGTPERCTTKFFVTRCTPGVVGWLHAKLAFKGTLVGMVTLIDHLIGAHLSTGNLMATANIEHLPADHALRRLLSPFSYGSASRDSNAGTLLAREHAAAQRALPLTTEGMRQVYRHANFTSATASLESPPERLARRGTADLHLPYDVDGLDYHALLRNLTRSYVRLYYEHGARDGTASAPDGAVGAPDACAADERVTEWYAAASSLLTRSSRLPSLSCASLAEVLASLLFDVSAQHQHVGSIGSEIRDPCFAPPSWREGELCGPPRTSFVTVLIIALTQDEVPTIDQDFSHLLLDERAKRLWADFRASLAGLGARVDARNRNRRLPFHLFRPRTLTSSISY